MFFFFFFFFFFFLFLLLLQILLNKIFKIIYISLDLFYPISLLNIILTINLKKRKN